MKFRTIAAILILTTSVSIAQQADTLARLTDPPVAVLKMNGESCRYLFSYGNHSDTLSFTGCEAELQNIMLKAVQVDGKGLKELVITWKTSQSTVNGDQRRRTVNQVWNLDARTILFTAISDYFNISKTSDTKRDSKGNKLKTYGSTETCLYNYDFSVDSTGQVTIKNLAEEYSSQSKEYDEQTQTENIRMDANIEGVCDKSRPDHKEGIYIFKNGKYILR